MAEFEIFINQTLVNKTLDNLDFDPLVLIDQNSSGAVNLLSASSYTEKDIEINFSENEYYKKGIELIEDEYKKSFVDEITDEENTFDFYDQPRFLRELEITSSSKKLSVKDLQDEKNLSYETQAEVISYASDFLSAYVITHPQDFQNDISIIQEAEQIFGRNESLVFNNTLLGFGGFFKKILNKGKRLLRRIGRWVRRQIKKVVGIGKPEMTEFKLVQYGRPKLILSNPIEVDKINAKVERLVLKIPYYIKFPWSPIRWRYITITLNNRLSAKLDSELFFKPKNLKIFTSIKVSSFKVKVKIVGVPFTIGLTGITNKVLEKKEFEIYDASNIAKPIQVKGLKYELTNLNPVGLDKGLRLDLDIDVSRN